MARLSLRWFWCRSIRWQLIIGFAGVTALLMTFFVMGLMRWEENFLLDRARLRVTFQAKFLAGGSRQMLAAGNAPAIMELLHSLAQDTSIRSARVTDLDGRIVADTDSAAVGRLVTDSAGSNVFHGSLDPRAISEGRAQLLGIAPVVVDGRPIGWAWVRRDLAVERTYLAQVGQAGLAYTLVAILAATIAAVLLSATILKPLRLLLAGADRVTHDRLDEPVPLTTQNEVGAVTLAFNVAMSRLLEQRDALCREVDERIRAQHETNQLYGLSQRRAAELDAVIESMPDAVYIGNPRGITKCNSKGLETLGLSSLEDLQANTHKMGKTFTLHSTVDGRVLTGPELPFSRALRGEVAIEELLIRRMDGSAEIWVRAAAAPIHQEDRIVGAVEIHTDITIEKRKEKSIRDAMTEAEEANRAKDHFLAILSHELRTPLTPVLTLAQMLERDPSMSADAHEDVVTIRRNVELEARLIDDLLDLTRINRGKIELRFMDVDVHEKLRNVLRLCEEDAAAKRIEVSLELWAEHVIVPADPARLQQVFWNLLKNAIKFTPPGGRVAIQTHNQPHDAGESPAGARESVEDLVIEVADTGIGIEPGAMPRLFEAFEQGGREVTRVYGGLGLGLTIGRALVERHGGQLTAESQGRDRGATFRVRLPLPIAPKTAPAAVPAAGTRNARRRILLVEDHPDTAKVTARLLTQCGYQVETADTVAAAIRLTRAQHFDLIVSDIGLPDGTGHELIRRLVAEAPNSGEHLKGIAISGFGSDDDLQRSLEAGFIEHLVKPVDPRRLVEAVDHALEMSAWPRE